MKSGSIELWRVVHGWILMSGSKVNAKYCKEEIETHSDYPAMTAATDFLDAGAMGYQVVQADVSYINEFNYPLLAHIRQLGNEYLHIIENVAVWEKQKEIIQHWSGIVLFAEKNAKWNNIASNQQQKNKIKNRILATTLFCIGIGIFILSIVQWQSIFINLFGFLSLTGMVISVFALGTELGYQSQVIKQVCGIVSKGGCEKVLKSRQARGIFGITPADLSLLYFTTQFSCYLLSIFYPLVLQPILLFSYTGIIIAGWSIYTQALLLKQWCALCLGIVTVLTLQILIALLVPVTLLPFTIVPYILFSTVFIVLLGVLLPIKQLVKINRANKQKLIEFKKWKTDASLFINQWQQEQEVDTTVWENDLLLGNPNAPIRITVACNPYCGPCVIAHKKLDDFLIKFSTVVNIQIRFLFNADKETDKRTMATKAILQALTTLKRNALLQQMLMDWFEWMDFEKWAVRWKANDNIDVTKALQQHANWIEKSDIMFTPTFFINGKKMPGRYNLNDLEALIPQLAETLAQ